VRAEAVARPVVAPPANSGLTKRERKVKDLLLRELGKRKGLTTMSYEEIQNIDKTLNVEWIDKQLVRMRKEYKHTPWFWPLYGLVMAFNGYNIFSGALTEESPFMLGLSVVFVLTLVAVGVATPFFHRSSLRRKIFIYEALRELAGADEAGVTLDQAVRNADDLIARIVDMELAAEAEKPAKSIGRVRTR
jgi:hypothetical protein